MEVFRNKRIIVVGIICAFALLSCCIFMAKNNTVMAASSDYLTFTKISSGYSVKLTNPNDPQVTEIEIPKTWQGFPVTEIATSGFASAQFLETVSIPATVTTINSMAFNNCPLLAQVHFRTSRDNATNAKFGVQEIGQLSFGNCPNLTSVILPATIIPTNVNTLAFRNSPTNITYRGTQQLSITGLTNNAQAISDPYSIVFETFDGKVGIKSCQSLPDNTEAIEIPNVDDKGNLIEFIMYDAFMNCKAPALTFASSFTSQELFLYSTSFAYSYIDEITLGGYIKYDKWSVGLFKESAFKKIILPELTIITDEMFLDCHELELIEFDGLPNILSDSITSIGANAFGNCYKLGKDNATSPALFIPAINPVQTMKSEIFSGWTNSQIITLEYDAIPSQFYANGVDWIGGNPSIVGTNRTYTVEYNANNGTKTVSGQMNNSNYTFNIAGNLRANSFSITGYTFQGWSKDEGIFTLGEGTNNTVHYSNQQNQTNAVTIGTITLYAVWKPITVTLSYSANGGNGAIATTSYNYDTLITLNSGANLSRTGYSIAGWYDSNTYEQYELGSALRITENFTLAARWQGMTVYVTLNKQNGTGGSDNLIFVYGGSTMSTLSAPSRYGFDFKGYYSGTNGSGTQYIDSTMKVVKTWDIAQSNVTLYAYWTGKTSVVIFDKNGGTGGTFSVAVTFGSPMPAATAPTYSGYEFLGYFGALSMGMQYYDANMNSTTDCDIVSTTAVTLYARWEKNCVAEGTLITLADGSQKTVETLTGNEWLLVWNLHTGTFDVAPILFIDSDPVNIYEIINLYFSDGTEVKVIDEHAFWDFDLNRYVFLRKDAAQYIGHWYNKQIVNKMLDAGFQFKSKEPEPLDALLTVEYVDEFFADLTDYQKRVAAKVFIEKYKQIEVADIENVTPKAINNLLKKIKKKISATINRNRKDS